MLNIQNCTKAILAFLYLKCVQCCIIDCLSNSISSSKIFINCEFSKYMLMIMNLQLSKPMSFLCKYNFIRRIEQYFVHYILKVVHTINFSVIWRCWKPLKRTTKHFNLFLQLRQCQVLKTYFVGLNPSLRTEELSRSLPSTTKAHRLQFITLHS